MQSDNISKINRKNSDGELHCSGTNFCADEVVVEVVGVNDDLNKAGDEFEPDEFLVVEVLVDPAHDVEDLVTSKSSHIRASDDLDFSSFVNDVELRDNCECFKPDREGPSVLIPHIRLGGRDVESQSQKRSKRVNEKEMLERVEVGVITQAERLLILDQEYDVKSRRNEKHLE
mgnify:FL=1